jgi:iron-sulfur cluster assembly accessory protein
VKLDANPALNRANRKENFKMITLTDRAAAEIKGLLEKQETPEALLRVFVAGGGCSGLQYGMSLEEEAMEGDEKFALNGVNVIVDPRSIHYLEGAEIDYVDSLMGGGFKIDNPNAKSSCGCGHSFTPKDEEGEEAMAGGGGCGSCSNSGF